MGPDERKRHEALLAQCPQGSCVDAGNDNSLRDFAARIALCDLVVTGDTLALHMACALDKPIVALFGPTSPWEIELYGKGEHLYAADLDCLVCYSNCDRSPSCMDLIDVDRVHDAVRRLLDDADAERVLA